MLCIQCKKNQATKTYVQIKNGVKQTQYYCLECDNRLFLCQQEAEGETALSACPYCGTTVEEFEKTNLVGCARCYQVLEKTIWPVVMKMQGKEAHKGKHPSLEEGFESGGVLAYSEKDAIEKTRFRRRCRELEMLIERLKKDGDEASAKRYEEKLLRMKQKMTIEEDFVW